MNKTLNPNINSMKFSQVYWMMWCAIMALLSLSSVVISDPIQAPSIGFALGYGIALSFLLMHGWRRISIVMIANVISTILLVLLSDWGKLPAWQWLTFTLLNCLSPLVAIVLLNVLSPVLRPVYFTSSGQFAGFVSVVGLAAPALLLVLVVGLMLTTSIEPSNYAEQFFFWWCSLFLGAIVITPLTTQLLYVSNEPREWRRVSVFLVFVGLVIAAIVVFTNKGERYARKLELEEVAQLISRDIDNRLLHIDDAIFVISQFFSGDQNVDKTIFNWYTQPFLKNEEGLSLSWNPKVNDYNLAAIQAQLNSVIEDRPIAIHQPSESGSNSDVKRLGDFKIVVLHITPLEPNIKAVGLDIYANPSRRLAINAAIQREKATATPPITLVQNNHRGVLLISPVSYEQSGTLNGQIGNLKGVVVGVIDLTVIMSSVLQLHQTATLEIKDVTDPANQYVVLAGPEQHNSVQQGISGVANFDWAGRHWQINVFNSSLGWLSGANLVRYGVPLTASLLLFWGMSLYLANQFRLSRTDSQLQDKSRLLWQVASIQHAFLTEPNLAVCLRNLSQAFMTTYDALGVAVYQRGVSDYTLAEKYCVTDDPQQITTFGKLLTESVNYAMASSVLEQEKAWQAIPVEGHGSQVLLVFPTANAGQLLGAVVVWSANTPAMSSHSEEHHQLLMTAAGIQSAALEQARSQQALETIQSAMEAKQQAQKRVRGQGDALAGLVQHEHIVAGSWIDSIHLICKATSRVLDASRVSVWSLSANSKQLVCESIYDANTHSFSAGSVINVKDIPTYFTALKCHSRINAYDAVNHPNTRELAESYLLVYGVKSMLDACIVKDGEIVGVVCVEELRQKREWQVDEENFVTIVAGLVAQLFLKEELGKAKAFSDYQRLERALVVDNIPDALATLDIQGKVTSCNPAFLNLFTDGLPLPEKRDIQQFLPAVDAQSLHQAPTQQYAMEVAGTRRNGDSFPVSVTVVRLPEDREVTQDACLVLLRDLSREKAQEQRLIQSQKLEALGQLTGTVAHDFNNILGIIVGYGQLVASEVDGDLQAYMKQIVSAGERAKTLIKQLLVFSTKDNKKTSFVDLNDVIDSMLPNFQQAASQRTLTFHACEKGLPALIESEQLEHVLLNLVVNAVHATKPDGSITLTTQAEKLDNEQAEVLGIAPGNYAILAIHDDGAGIHPDMLVRIFEPFVTTKGKQGTGLGLAQVLAYMKNLGGSVVCNSKPGEGTVFTLYFPTQRKRPTEQPVLTSEPGESKTVLIVDDEELLARLFATQLDKLGYQTRVSTTVADAKQQLLDAPVDLLLSDIKMPDGGGLALVSFIREHKLTCYIQLMSGYSDEAGWDSTEKQLIEARLTKPFTGDELQQALESCFSCSVKSSKNDA